MEFNETFEAHHSVFDSANSGDSDVTWTEFHEYYKNISFIVESDNLFKSILKNTWDIQEGSFNQQNQEGQ